MDNSKFDQVIEKIAAFQKLKVAIRDNEQKFGNVNGGKKETLENWLSHMDRNLKRAQAAPTPQAKLAAIRHLAAIAVAALISNDTE